MNDKIALDIYEHSDDQHNMNKAGYSAGHPARINTLVDS